MALSMNGQLKLWIWLASDGSHHMLQRIASHRFVDEFSILISSLAFALHKDRPKGIEPSNCLCMYTVYNVLHIWSYQSYHRRFFCVALWLAWFAQFCWLKSNEVAMPERHSHYEEEWIKKNQMVRSKWLVFNVIIASHCGKCLDIFVRKHKRARRWTRATAERIRAKKKQPCRQRVHMH